MEILTGLFEHGVWQRGATGASQAIVTGTCGRDGHILAFIEQDGTYLPEFEGATVGESRDGRFEARIDGVPTGGPYDVQLSLVTSSGKWLETVLVRDLLVGDVWLLAGQSNMQGVGLLAEASAPDPQVRAFFMDDRWDVAADPIHNISAAVDDVHRVLCGGALPPQQNETGVGPGLPFASAMRERRGVPQGVIACAHGGTSMTQWDPARRDEGGNSLYGALVRRLRKNGGQVAGMIWYQGESDANADACKLYTQRMVDLVKAVRADTGSPELPVAIVQIARVIGWGDDAAGYWNSVQEQERLLPRLLPALATVPAIDLSLDDGIHISARGMQTLGRRLAEAIDTVAGVPGALPPPIEPVAARVFAAQRQMATIEITFENVVGELTANGRPWGFQIGEDGAGRIYDVRLEGSKVLLGTGMSVLQAEAHSVYYGRGANPYCNIVDGAGRSLPVFGPFRIGRSRALTTPNRDFLVSPLLPGAGDLAAANEPATDGWTEFHAPQDFASRRDLLAGVGEEDGAIGYRCQLHLSEPMELVVMLGYDGPVKVWLDGREFFHDPAGANPATMTDACLAVNLPAGYHPLTVLLGANRGRAWGIFLGCERLDVTADQLADGTEVLPEIGL